MTHTTWSLKKFEATLIKVPKQKRPIKKEQTILCIMKIYLKFMIKKASSIYVLLNYSMICLICKIFLIPEIGIRNTKISLMIHIF